jgi:muconolactone delta-isomerase
VYFIAAGTGEHPERIGRYLPEEGAVVAELRREGRLKAVYLRADGRGVFNLVEAANIAEATQQLARLPLLREGLLSFELTEVKEL